MNATLPQLVQLFEGGRSLVYQKDDVIIRPGDVPSGVYYLESGGVKVYSLCKNGEPNIIMTLCPGEIFPVAWAVSGTMRDIGFDALGPTKAVRIPRTNFVHALSSSSAVMNDAMQALAHHFFTLTNEIDNLQYRSAREKVVYRLIFLARHFGECQDSLTTITLRVTNDYIARSTNMTRETASRELSRLNRKQLIRMIDGRIVIPDLTHLGNEISRHFNLTTLSLD
jgi:CRP-like cAMP-binding protein